MRFKEWGDEWRCLALGEICSFYKGNFLSKADLTDDGLPCILYGQLYTTYLSEAISQVYSRTNTCNTNIEKSLIGDLIIPCSGETAEDIATARCVQVPEVLYGGDLNVLRSQSHDCLFLSFQLNGKRRKDIAKLAVGKTVVHLHASDLIKLRIYCPSHVDEERKIARFLSILNSRIELQSKIIKALKALRKALYFIIFGTSKFESRLHLVKEFLEVDEPIKAKNPNRFRLITVRLNEAGVVNNVNVDTLKMSGTIYYKRHKGQFIYGKQNLFHGAFGIVPEALDGYFSSGDVPALSFKNESNSAIFLRAVSYVAYSWEKYASGTGSKRIHESQLLECEIPMPSENYISACEFLLSTIDEKILVEQRIETLLKAQKTYLLSTMFI